MRKECQYFIHKCVIVWCCFGSIFILLLHVLKFCCNTALRFSLNIYESWETADTIPLTQLTIIVFVHLHEVLGILGGSVDTRVAWLQHWLAPNLMFDRPSLHVWQLRLTWLQIRDCIMSNRAWTTAWMDYFRYPLWRLTDRLLIILV